MTACDKPGSNLPTTNWSLVGRAGLQAEALNQLLHRYSGALLAHLMRKFRLNHDQAEDLLQGFLCDKVIEKGIVEKAEESRGRFRSFLLTVLDRYVLDHIRAQSRHTLGNLEIDPADSSVVPDAFTVAWAQNVLKQTIQRTRQHFVQTNKPEIWRVFELRLLKPHLQGTAMPSYALLVRQLDFSSPIHASNALITAKRAFQRIVKEVVGEYVTGGDDIDAEIRDLQRILGRHGSM